MKNACKHCGAKLIYDKDMKLWYCPGDCPFYGVMFEG